MASKTTVFQKEEIFIAPDLPSKSNLPRSQTEPQVTTKTTTIIQTQKRRVSTGSDSFPTLTNAPHSNSKRVNAMLSSLKKGTPMTPEKRKSKLGKGLNDVVIHNEMETLQILLEQGADPNGTKSSPCTPLYVAVDMDNYEACEILLDAGASLVKPSRSKRETPLELALNRKNSSALPLIMERLEKLEKNYFAQLLTNGQEEELDISEPPRKKRRVN